MKKIKRQTLHMINESDVGKHITLKTLEKLLVMHECDYVTSSTNPVTKDKHVQFKHGDTTTELRFSKSSSVGMYYLTKHNSINH